MAASRIPIKAHLHVPEPSSTIPQIPSKSHSNFLCKSLIIVLAILVIPLFPSQAPDFITESFLTQFWEIFHLLFIGIVVSYGLFSRKTAQTDTERTVHYSTTDASHEYLSGISDLSSIFENGFENLGGSDEQDVLQSYGNFQYLQSSSDQFLGKDHRIVVEKSRKIGSFVTKDGTEGVSESDGKRTTRIRRSQWLKDESFVMVSNGKEFLDKNSDIMPLNLPVRSLRTRIVDNDRPKTRNRREASPKFDVDGNNDVEVVKIRGVDPKTFEKKFEGVAGPKTIPWRSRSGRMETGGDWNNPKPPAHPKPQSFGEFEFENLKSKSFRGSTNSSSPELRSPKVENLESKMEIMQPVISDSHPKIAPLDAEASFSSAKPQSRSFGGSAEMNVPMDFEFNLRKSGDCEEDDGIGKGKKTIESFESDMRSPTLAKVLTKAKSVRTIKPIRYIVGEKDQCLSEADGKVGRKFSKIEAVTLIKRGKGEEPEDSSVNYRNQKLDSIFPMPKPKPVLPEIHNKEKGNIDDRNIKEFEEGTGSEFDKSSDEDDAEHNFDNDAELEGSEVDRKASEFIAKFREQIRLQKMSSVKGYDDW